MRTTAAHVARTRPLRERRARDGKTGALEDPFLAVQRLVIGELRYEHLGQQAGRRDPLIDNLCRNRGLDQPLTAPADPFTADVPFDLEHPRGVIELLAHVLPDPLERAATAALGLFGFMANLAAGQMPRQCNATGLLLRRPIGRRFLECFELDADRLEILVDRLLKEASLAALELLTAPPEAPALEDRHLVGQLIDLQLLDPDRFILLRQLPDERGGKFTQRFCVHLGEIRRRVHAGDDATGDRTPTAKIVTTRGSNRTPRAAPTAGLR